ncbi:MAG TPA: adenosylcobinamide-GDP ribazoletransferase [Ktedonobacteraceae bacterium]|nr:adenosylcobinamide-GDP ribazoletransferase [Ktedonobacteraceae bacterium]
MNNYSTFFRNNRRRSQTSRRHNNEPEPGNGSWLLQQYREFVAAVQFLTVVPWPGSRSLFSTYDDESDPGMIIGSAYFSLVGGLLALLLCLLPLILGTVFPSMVLAALVLVAQILLTGGLHLDGLMDSCDGLFSGRDPERKLEIMRDSRVGSFGVLGAVCILLVKFASYASLNVHVLPLVLLTVLPSARWAMLLAVYVFPNARQGGLGEAFRQTLTMPRLVCAGVIALLFALVWGHLAGLFIWAGATVISLLLGAGIVRTLGGLTGDSYGAIEEATEAGALLLALLFIAWF